MLNVNIYKSNLQLNKVRNDKFYIYLVRYFFKMQLKIQNKKTHKPCFPETNLLFVVDISET